MSEETRPDDLSFQSELDACPADLAPELDRRAFLMRSVVIGAAATIAGCSRPSPEQVVAQAPPAPAATAAAAPPLAADLEVVKKAKGPVMTTLEEFYKVGPGPSSSHTIGPMRITYEYTRRPLKAALPCPSCSASGCMFA